eukprot:555380-Amphidinium_carterae.1
METSLVYVVAGRVTGFMHAFFRTGAAWLGKKCEVAYENDFKITQTSSNNCKYFVRKYYF